MRGANVRGTGSACLEAEGDETASSRSQRSEAKGCSAVQEGGRRSPLPETEYPPTPRHTGRRLSFTPRVDRADAGGRNRPTDRPTDRPTATRHDRPTDGPTDLGRELAEEAADLRRAARHAHGSDELGVRREAHQQRLLVAQLDERLEEDPVVCHSDSSLSRDKQAPSVPPRRSEPRGSPCSRRGSAS